MARATLIGFSAIAMWALLALLTDASGAVPPFLLSAIYLCDRHRASGWSSRLCLPPPTAAEDSVAGLGGRHCRPVRLPLLLLHRAAQRAGGRGQPDRLSVAAADRARLGADARREAALASRRRRAARACRHGPDRHQGRRRRASTRRYVLRLCRWPASAPSSGRPIRCCRGASPQCRPPSSPGSARPPRCFRSPAISRWRQTVLPRGAGQWLAVLGLGLMPVGAAFYAWDYRRQARQHPGAWRGELCGAAAVDPDPDRRRLRRSRSLHILPPAC